jgi:hypothetical protein
MVSRLFTDRICSTTCIGFMIDFQQKMRPFISDRGRKWTKKRGGIGKGCKRSRQWERASGRKVEGAGPEGQGGTERGPKQPWGSTCREGWEDDKREEEDREAGEEPRREAKKIEREYPREKRQMATEERAEEKKDGEEEGRGTDAGPGRERSGGKEGYHRRGKKGTMVRGRADGRRGTRGKQREKRMGQGEGEHRVPSDFGDFGGRCAVILAGTRG